ncbi:MAG TPA: efflux RND transporter periplasmic adaptor subunit [Tepidisphaeraceae bacterium]|nr:efflux RND transporter periplasmic adaptor subunit [Tepidisphaeraceae bacterium]
MMNHRLARPMAAALLTITAWTGCQALAEDSAPAPSAPTAVSPGQSSFVGITNPSEQRGLNFNIPGVVAKVLVKEGDHVKAGDLIAQEDDSVDQAEWLSKQAEAETSKLQIEAAKADCENKKVELARNQAMYAKKVVGKSELEKAQLDVVIDEIRIRLAEQETKQKELEAKAQEAKTAQRKLYSTIDGIVQKINVHEGELATNDPKTPCMTVVLNEPLYVEVELPISAAKNLQLHQKLAVRYTDEQGWEAGELVFFNPVATANAGMQHIRLQLANPDHKRSGHRVDVKLGEKVAAAADSR